MTRYGTRINDFEGFLQHLRKNELEHRILDENFRDFRFWKQKKYEKEDQEIKTVYFKIICIIINT